MDDTEKEETQPSPAAEEKKTETTPATEAPKPYGFIENLPFIKNLLNRIDSRTLFTEGMYQTLRTLTILGLFIGGIVLLLAAFTSMTYDTENSYMNFEGSTKFFAALINLSMFGALVANASLILQRSTQIQEMENPTVIGIFFALVRIIIEVAAVNSVIYLMAYGFITMALGPDAGSAIMLASMSIPEGIGDIMPSSGEFWIRFSGVMSVAGSYLAGFFILFLGYVGHDILHTLYTFLKRK